RRGGVLSEGDVMRLLRDAAEVLAYLHGRAPAVIHRDLKPGNVMLTPAGAKLLDFGLARPDATESGPDAPTEQQPLTGSGMIVGTLPYMSPEQLQGHEVDARTDIFALGAVLYEMVTGVRAFAAPDSASLIAAILGREPAPISARAPLTPPLLEHIISDCLAKERDARFRCAADVARELRFVPSSVASGTAQAPPLRRARWPYAAIAVGALLAGAAAATLWTRDRGAGDPFANATFTQLTFDAADEREPAISPDGKLFAFVKSVGGQRDIFLQRVGGRSAINLTNEPGFDDSEPSFSPDGSQIAFRSERDGGGIFLMGATGESVRRLTDKGYAPSWSPDGKQLVFAEQRHVDPTFVYGIANLYVVDVPSGAVRLFHDGIDVLQPRWSPSGKRVAYWSPTRGTRDILTIASGGAKESVVNVTDDRATDWSPAWAPDGRHLYFSSDRGGTMNLWRVAIDEESGEPSSELEPLRTPARYAGYPSLSADGTRIIYQSDAVKNEIVRVDIDATNERAVVQDAPVFSGSMALRYTAISPDGASIAFMAATPEEDVYVMSADGSDLRQLTDDPARDRGMDWTADGSRILFYSNRSGAFQAYSIKPDGSGLTQLTAQAGGVNFPRLSADGRHLAFVPDMKGSAAIAPIGPDGKAGREVPLPDPPRGRFLPRAWSPDGRLLLGAPYGTPGLFLYDATTRAMQDLGIPARLGGFIDASRVVFVDTSGRIGIVDLRDRATRYIGALPKDPSRSEEWSFMSTNGRTILAIRSQRQSDIWLMQLPQRTPQ
ncbi:MAG TPA: protein kinase, partial [Thermoanaerobaculia bacterium]|nr:protein kinase [Thermoanaerobaculia bacterium]